MVQRKDVPPLADYFKDVDDPRIEVILITPGIPEREVPVTEENPEKSKKGLYRIKDNFLQFWFRFVFPRMGYIELGRSGEVLEQIRQNFIDGHVSYVREDICREKMRTPDFKKRGDFSNELILL